MAILYLVRELIINLGFEECLGCGLLEMVWMTFLGHLFWGS